jgi:hypothetical protein
MNASSEQTHIVRTVIRAFFPTVTTPGWTEKASKACISYAEGSVSKATARVGLREAFGATGQALDEERLNLCIETAQGLHGGCVCWFNEQGNDVALDVFPTWEFHRVYERVEAVDWVKRWRECGGRIFSRGEMIALKSDPIWIRISEFRLPFPPFDLDSGMHVDGIPRKEAEELGLLAKGEIVRPRSITIDFEEALRTRVEFYFSAESRRQRFEREIAGSDVSTLLRMADQRMAEGDENETEAVHDSIHILQHAIQRGFDGNFERQHSVF